MMPIKKPRQRSATHQGQHCNPTRAIRTASRHESHQANVKCLCLDSGIKEERLHRAP